MFGALFIVSTIIPNPLIFSPRSVNLFEPNFLVAQITDIRAPAQKLVEKLTSVEAQYPLGGDPLWHEFRQIPAPDYASALADILFERAEWRDERGERRENRTLGLLRWPRALAEQAALFPPFDPTRTEGWRDRLLRLHDNYSRTLVTVYCYLESLKRAYLLPEAMMPLSSSGRSALITEVRGLHAAAQALMKVFHELRFNSDYASVMPYHREVLGKTWELHYSTAYHFGLTLNADPDRIFARRSLSQYFAPFVAATALNPRLTSNDVASLLIEYRRIQRELMDPAKKDDPVLKARLRELQSRLIAMGVDFGPSVGNGETSPPTVRP